MEFVLQRCLLLMVLPLLRSYFMCELIASRKVRLIER